MKVVKIMALIALTPFVVYVALMAIFILVELTGSDQSWASSVGLSIRECMSVSTKLGMPAAEAETMCSRRVPKK